MSTWQLVPHRISAFPPHRHCPGLSRQLSDLQPVSLTTPQAQAQPPKTPLECLTRSLCQSRGCLGEAPQALHCLRSLQDVQPNPTPKLSSSLHHPNDFLHPTCPACRGIHCPDRWGGISGASSIQGVVALGSGQVKRSGPHALLSLGDQGLCAGRADHKLSQVFGGKPVWLESLLHWSLPPCELR